MDLEKFKNLSLNCDSPLRLRNRTIPRKNKIDLNERSESVINRPVIESAIENTDHFNASSYYASCTNLEKESYSVSSESENLDFFHVEQIIS
ncbi:unnamed protein product [Brachionus calyciflorus]|uniref:Uncharacterized protein n=1 Tax=Brachionus calyciflorus TaxID=104777 RepID=A0A814DF12_9BILA|nr:unnamed protein product [Brachionus calyciflorus]